MMTGYCFRKVFLRENLKRDLHKRVIETRNQELCIKYSLFMPT